MQDIILNELRQVKRSGRMLAEKYDTALAWIKKSNKGISIKDMIKERGFEDVIIYGIDELGMRLIESCIRESVKIAAISDRSIEEGGYEFDNIPMVKIKDIAGYQDEKTGIIVSAVGHFEDIEKNLRSLGLHDIVSLRNLIG